jgi:hypothetical protein
MGKYWKQQVVNLEGFIIIVIENKGAHFKATRSILDLEYNLLHSIEYLIMFPKAIQ